MLGMGLTFSAGVGLVASAVIGIPWLVMGGGPLPELAKAITAFAIWAFPIGVAFSGVTALTARGRSLDSLSIPRFAAMGAAAGLVLYGVLALNAWDAWSLRNALGNAAIFIGLGSGSATASLLLARRAGPELSAADEALTLEEG